MLRFFVAFMVMVSVGAEELKYKDFNEAATAVAIQVAPCFEGFPNPDGSLNTYMTAVMRLPGSKTGAMMAASVSLGGINGSNFETGLKRFDADIVRSAFTFAEKKTEVRRLARDYPEAMVEGFLTRQGDGIPVIMAAGAEILAANQGVTKADIAKFKTRDFNINALTGQKPVLHSISVRGMEFIKNTDGAGPLSLMVYEMLKKAK
jgi:hypothetical protein